MRLAMLTAVVPLVAIGVAAAQTTAVPTDLKPGADVPAATHALAASAQTKAVPSDLKPGSDVPAATEASAASAQTKAVPTDLKLTCNEQPGVRVVVNAAGELASEGASAGSDGPVVFWVVNLDHEHEGPDIPARIDSDAAQLTAATAIWNPGNSVDADDGRLRLDLTTNTLFLVEPSLGNQALFRRFQCRDGAGTAAERHYLCGAGRELWVRFESGAGDASRAYVRYGDGALELTQVPSGSGARYADGGNLLWIKGDEAIFTPFGAEEQRCDVAD